MQTKAITIAIITLFISTILALDPIVIKGNRFFNNVTGQGFWIKGLDYQPRTGYPDRYDPLADQNIDWFVEDVKRFSDIGVNTIRVYEVHTTNSHGLAMKELEKAGIRLLLDIPEAMNAIDRSNPTWTDELFDLFKIKIDEFIQYPALLGFVAGNEVANLIPETAAMPYVKASIRDIKAYIRSKGKNIPVGYAATDVPTIETEVRNYLDCGDEADRADFYGVNIYSWCSPSTFDIAYKKTVETLADSDVPVVFSEYGCNYPNRTRDFAEVPVIYGPLMNSVISGGFVFEYSEEVNSFGLGKSYYSNYTYVPFADYYYLKKGYTTVNPTGPSYDEFVPKGTKKACPEKNATNWVPQSYPLPRTPIDSICECVKTKLTCRTVMTDPHDITADDGEKIGQIFGYICGSNNALCASVVNDWSNANYGLYSSCDPLVTVSIVMSLYYNANGKDPKNCDFNGFATVVAQPENIDCGYELDSTDYTNRTDVVVISRTSAPRTFSTFPRTTIHPTSEKVVPTTEDNIQSRGNTNIASSATNSPGSSSVGSTSLQGSNTMASTVGETSVKDSVHSSGVIFKLFIINILLVILF